MAGVNNFSAGQVLSAAALNGNFNALPYGFSVGTAATTTGTLASNAEATATVTFPASRFTVAPVVLAWTGSRRYIAVATTVAAGSATIIVRNVSDAQGTNETIYYQAVQMTSGTAVG
jgi:hypothetical protein